MAGASLSSVHLKLKLSCCSVAADSPKSPRVLVLSGTGRVGGSTALALSNLYTNLHLIVAGRNREKGAEMVTTLGAKSEFCHVDINDHKSLESALQDTDIVVHVAGPFQQAEKCTILEVALRTKTAYVDVCDDTAYAFRAKSLHDRAVAANVPAITTAGIYPGVSNGTGGAGPTILATSFLLLGEEVAAFNNGEKMKLRPYSVMLKIDFGKGIGKKDVYLLNLPEVRSTHEILGVPTVSSRFGTAPFFWNWAMEAMTALLPAEWLRDRSKVQQMVKMFDPVVRVVADISGERVSMRVDLDCSGGRNTVSVFSHKKLSVSVGTSTAAFVMAVLEGSTKPGVWFPEEAGGIAI